MIDSEYYNDEGDVVCQECGHAGEHIFHHISSEHDWDKETYQRIYDGAPVTSRHHRNKIGRENKRKHFETLSISELGMLLEDFQRERSELNREIEMTKEIIQTKMDEV